MYSKLKDCLGIIIAGAAVVGLVSGGLSYFAKADDLRMVELRLDQKIVSDQVSQIQVRIWQLEDRNQGRPCTEWKSPDEKQEYRALQIKLEELKKQQDRLIKK